MLCPGLHHVVQETPGPGFWIKFVNSIGVNILFMIFATYDLNIQKCYSENYFCKLSVDVPSSCIFSLVLSDGWSPLTCPDRSHYFS